MIRDIIIIAGVIVIENMIKYGGSFVRQLGQLFLRADDDNFQKLRMTFDNYWKQYENFGKAGKEDKDE